MISAKRKIYLAIFGVLFLLWCIVPFWNTSDAWWLDFLFWWGGGKLPQYERDFSSQLTAGWYVIEKEWVQKTNTLRENIMYLFYPNDTVNSAKWNVLYKVIRDITLWVMIIFIVWTWASLLLWGKAEESKKKLSSLIYVLLWWVFVYGANRLFGEVLNFWRMTDTFTAEQTGIWWVTNAFIWEWSVLFVILSAVKAFAFFLAIIMIVVTWFKVIAAWEWEKWKKLMKWLINVVVALLIIKWVDFIYYLAGDSKSFVSNAADLIVNVATVFAYIYWIIVVIMVIAAWYLYITDGWDWGNFKKATNVLVNILLSALVLFSFLLIAYQIFAEFQEWWDAVSDTTEQQQETPIPESPTAYITVNQNYIKNTQYI